MKLRHHDTTAQAPSHETRSPAPGRVTRSEMLPASGVVQPVQASAAAPLVDHEDPFAMHMIGSSVQQRGGGVSPDDVHAAAAHGISGSGGALPHLEQIQASFGPEHDVSHIQAHVGGAAAEGSAAMGAQAYATGDHVAFANAPDLHTAAHEAAHVVQQRGGLQLAGGVGRAGDPYEQHADQVADAVVRGESASALLASHGGSPGRSVVPQRAVQRFEADEHQSLGAAGSGGAMVELAPGYQIPFGDVVALAGDHFESIEQMRRFARKKSGKESRAEIEWARIWKLSNPAGVDISAWHDVEAREAQEQRYYQLAGRNQSHFLAPRAKDRGASPAEMSGVGNDRAELAAARYLNGLPRNAPEGYRINHIRAIFEAVEAARAKATANAAKGAGDAPTLGVALATEAFGCHFLTDSFAGGHVRTARQDLKTHWDPKVPMFFVNLVGLLGDLIAANLQPRGAYGVFSQSFLASGARDTVNDELQRKAAFTFGDLIAGALHHQDNEHGVHVQAGGTNAHLVGDGELDNGTAAAGQTRGLATRAVRLGTQEVRQAYELGSLEHTSPIEIIEGFLAAHGGRFGAETMVPDASTVDESKSPEAKWRVETVEELLRDAVFVSGATIFLTEQASELRAMAKGLGGAQEDALVHGVVDQLVADPIDLIRRAVNWTPGSGYAHSWQSKNDSNDYVDEASRRHALPTLTLAQRISLVKTLTEDLMPERDSDGERNVERGHPEGARNRSGATILDLLDTASPEDARVIIDTVGRDAIDRWLTPELRIAFVAKYGQRPNAAP